MQYVKLEDLVSYTGIEPVYYPEDVQSRIYTPDIVRPGLQMAGYFEWFSFERVQVMGKAEILYIETLDEEVKKERLLYASVIVKIPVGGIFGYIASYLFYCFFMIDSLGVIPKYSLYL